MAMTSSTITLVTSGSSSSESTTQTAGHVQIAFPTDAIRFFIIAAAVICSFGLLTLGCCISYRIRQNRMRRLIVAAFEQDIFDRERVRQRIVQLRRDAPLHDFLKASAQTSHPQYFEAYIDSYSSYTLSDKPGEQVLPLAAEIARKPSDSVNMATYSKFSALSIDRQLALLYQVNGKRRKHKGRTQSEDGEEMLSQHNHNIQPHQSHRTLTLACLVSMPNPRRTADLERCVLALGTTVYPWEDNQVHPAKDVSAVKRADPSIS